MSHRCNRHFWDRREFLFRSGGGISGLALAYLLDRDGLLATPRRSRRPARRRPSGVNPYAPKPPHFKPRATAVISLFMGGGWSQVDTFDPKPALDEVRRPADRRQGQGRRDRAAGVPRAADAEPVQLQEVRPERHRGVGDLPALSQHVDEIAFLRSVYGRSNDHVQGTYEMQTGQINLGFPERRLVGHLRPRLGRIEPAGVRRDDRCARRPAGRAERLERRLHARRLSGHALPLHRRSDRRSEAARRR